MSKQCLSIEQMQHLKELGVDTSKANVYWHNVVKFEKKKTVNEWILSLSSSVPLMMKTIPTFTLQDILDLLPATVDDDYRLYIDKGLVLWTVGYVDAVSEIYEVFRERDLIDAAYEMLCWVIENGYLKVK